MIAPTGQTVTHDGSSPRSMRCAQKWHFSTAPRSLFMYSASYGHACMHARQPMQASRSTSTIPSGRFSRAFTGQIVTQGASVQWLQRWTRK